MQAQQKTRYGLQIEEDKGVALASLPGASRSPFSGPEHHVANLSGGEKTHLLLGLVAVAIAPDGALQDEAALGLG